MAGKVASCNSDMDSARVWCSFWRGRSGRFGRAVYCAARGMSEFRATRRTPWVVAGIRKHRPRRPGTAVGGRLSSLPGLHGHPLKLQVPLAGTFIMIHHENLADNLKVSFSRITGEN